MSPNANRRVSIAGLVWILAALGIGAGSLNMFVSHQSRNSINHQRQATEITQAELEDSVGKLREQREFLIENIDLCLQNRDEQQPTREQVVDLSRTIEVCKQSYGKLVDDADEQTRLFDLIGSNLEQLRQVESDAAQLSKQLNLIIEQREEAIAHSRTNIHAAISAAKQRQGKQRLEQVIAVRRFRASQTEDSLVTADAIIESLLQNDRLHSCDADLNELAVLIEQLIGTTDVEELRSLKDNRIRQSLARLRRGAEKIGKDHESGMLAHVNMLQTTLFGTEAYDDPAHQSMVCGIGGLYTLQRDFILAQARMVDLGERADVVIAESMSTEFLVADVIGDLAALNAERNIQTLRQSDRLMFGASAVILVLYLCLALTIARLGRKAESQLIENNRILDEAKQKAEAASVAKSEFLANMSHEIRTPMTAILGFADMLVEEKNLAEKPEQTAKAVSTIHANACHLLTIINDILDMSKIEAGKMTVESRDTDVMKILQEVATLMIPQGKKKGLEVKLHYDSTVPKIIQSDPTRIRQIILNLVGNAIKFTEKGSVQINVSYEPVDRRMQVAVVDTGIGMSKEQCDVISRFDAFSQANTSMSRRFGGTGLGLRISNSFAQMLGGGVKIESQLGEGSTFTVSFGVGDQEIELVKPSELPGEFSQTKNAATQGTPLAGVRVLLAEDGIDNQRIITLLLKKAGAKVTIAENGLKALEAIKQHGRFDVVLMDMQMPEMDGYTATRVLRQENYDHPIIAVTAHAMAEDRQKCLDAGCDDFTTKPIDRTGLISLVSKHATKSAHDLLVSAG